MSVLVQNSALVCRENHPGDQRQLLASGGGSGFSLTRWWSSGGSGAANRRSRRGRKAGLRGSRNEGFWPDLSRPTAVRMGSIADSEQLDQILQQARHRSQPVVVDWMAAWCRKCIYLKPKLEKLAAEYETKVRFYYVDVNRVPKALVKRGNISKMPTIQIWKDGEMKEEVIGGHKGWLVLEEVREMIQRFV